MKAEDFEAACLSKPGTHKVVQWGGSHVYKVGPKVFALWSFGPGPADGGPVFKVGEIAFEMLLETGLGRRAPYFAKGWVRLETGAALSDADITHYVGEAWAMVAASLPRKDRLALGLEA
ncbi:MAG: MmcQ/YjbR family DNA-binding protein [Caulobacteraceae bacterium]